MLSIIFNYIVRKVFITGLLLGFFIQFVFSQNRGEHVNGGRFLKRVENNLLINVLYNLDSKGGIEKMFFGDFNAPVEFFFYPSHESASGFRIIKGASNTSFFLEIKHISNYEEAINEAKKKYPVTEKFYDEELPEFLKVETQSFPISEQFAEKLYQKMKLYIDGFKVKGLPQGIFGGYSVTFRTVVDDEVWSLWIHMPQGDALKMADLCRQILTDASANQLVEKKYISILKTFEKR